MNNYKKIAIVIIGAFFLVVVGLFLYSNQFSGKEASLQKVDETNAEALKNTIQEISLKIDLPPPTR